MCNFGLDGTGVFEKLIQIFFLTAGCVVNYTGLLLAILLVGFLPLYIYGYFVFSNKYNLSVRYERVCCVVALLFTVVLSCILWMSAAVMRSGI